MFGLSETCFLVRADLDGIFSTEKNRLCFIVSDSCERFRNHFSMIEAAASNVVGGGREGNNDGILGKVVFEFSGEKFSEDWCERASGMIFIVMNNLVKETATFVNEVGWWLVFTFLTFWSGL